MTADFIGTYTAATLAQVEADRACAARREAVWVIAEALRELGYDDLAERVIERAQREADDVRD